MKLIILGLFTFISFSIQTATCYYQAGDNNLSGDNSYGSFTCKQNIINQFWRIGTMVLVMKTLVI